MNLDDQRVHSTHSFDSGAEPSVVVEHAIAAGVAGVTFTENLDTHPEDWSGCVYDDAAYSATIRELRQRFGLKAAVFVRRERSVVDVP